MKPYIVFVEKTKDNKILFTEEEVKKLIDKAYDDGYHCGYFEGLKTYWYNYPITYNSQELTNNSPYHITYTDNTGTGVNK